MREGTPSVTARRVAAYRLGFERLEVPFGDPSADERLARDVADSQQFQPNERMARYLRGRTAFFDRVVVGAMERNVSQVAAIGAGYDGRSLRYGKRGVRWFEVDHPDTQADKRLRLGRLEIDTSQVTFVGIDLAAASVGAALIDTGWDPDGPSLMLCEGLAVYLDATVLEALLEDLRAVATAGTRLAMSSPPAATTPADLARRERFRTAIDAVGEPARNSLTSEQVGSMLVRARWRKVDLSERAQRAGFVVATPVWEPAVGDAPPTASRVGRFHERIYHRSGMEGLSGHLAATYAIAVTGLQQLDLGVFRVERRDGPDWIARVFPAARPIEAGRGDAEILLYLEEAGFPAERCPHPEPVTTYRGQAVLVTERAAGRTPEATPTTFRLLGDLVGRLHVLPSMPAAGARPGGGWHHLVLQGDPREELAAAHSLLDDAAARVPASQGTLYEALRSELSRGDACDDLPKALIHPDCVPANLVGSSRGDPLLVDWTGAGRGSRLWSLAFLLWAAGARNLECAEAVAAGYRRHVRVEPAELDRLASAVATRPLVFGCWAFSTGRAQLHDVAGRLPTIRARARVIAERACAALDTPD